MKKAIAWALLFAMAAGFTAACVHAIGPAMTLGVYAGTAVFNCTLYWCLLQVSR